VTSPDDRCGVDRLFRLEPLVMGLLGLLAACGSDSESASSTGGDDGRYRPEPSGSPTDEDSACARLRTAIETKASGLGCIVTLQACPSLVRAAGNAACSTYDDGTVTGCESYYGEAESCEDLDFRRENCVLSTIGEAECM
jgi:hypothetical protein